MQKDNMVVKYFLNHKIWGFAENLWKYAMLCGMMISTFYRWICNTEGEKSQ